ncbi:hypothetical protein [Oricola thermophila]|uniref:DUF11 domain-containing protein n=1 Tax=Oricola thermophila TaxID=2742145 RepID=A0A6N1V8Z2_9HYPH|nr:hypothetical protein [Oricola thermophila]QKV17434.1 hypothetical protein HTY61_02605 [Oricola thermophila]
MNRPDRCRLVAFLLSAIALLASAGPAWAEITSSAAASGRYRGENIVSNRAALSIEVEPASPALAVRVDGSYDDGDGVAGKSVGDTVQLDITVENTGDTGMDGIAVTLALEQDGEALGLVEPPRLVAGDDSNPGVLDRDETWHFQAHYPIAFPELRRSGPIIASAAVSGLGSGRSVTASSQTSVELPPLQGIDPHLISLSHAATRLEAQPGELVEYALTVGNRSDRVLAVRLSAQLGDGIEYVADAGAEGEARPVPSEDGRGLDFGTVQVASASSVTIRYAGRVSGDVADGYRVNDAAISDPRTGLLLAPTARATVGTGSVSRSNCRGIAVHVFDDRNRNGVHDAGEAGIPGVRVLMEGGPTLTTGPDGRFVSPCEPVSPLASVEMRLLLDERTLPKGHYATTANPEHVRIGRGETARIAFGAAAARVIRLDLNAAAFLHESSRPDQRTIDGIARLISILGQERSILRLTYHAHREPVERVESRLAAVRKTVLDYWTASGGAYDLDIDARIVLNDG